MIFNNTSEIKLLLIKATISSVYVHLMFSFTDCYKNSKKLEVKPRTWLNH